MSVLLIARMTIPWWTCSVLLLGAEAVRPAQDICLQNGSRTTGVVRDFSPRITGWRWWKLRVCSLANSTRTDLVSVTSNLRLQHTSTSILKRMIVSLEQSCFFSGTEEFSRHEALNSKHTTGRFNYKNPWYKSNVIVDVVTSHWFIMSHEFNGCNFWGSLKWCFLHESWPSWLQGGDYLIVYVYL